MQFMGQIGKTQWPVTEIRIVPCHTLHYTARSICTGSNTEFHFHSVNAFNGECISHVLHHNLSDSHCKPFFLRISAFIPLLFHTGYICLATNLDESNIANSQGVTPTVDSPTGTAFSATCNTGYTMVDSNGTNTELTTLSGTLMCASSGAWSNRPQRCEGM